LLTNLYWEQVCTITFNLFLRTKLVVKTKTAKDVSRERSRYVAITPDVALVKGVQHPDAATYVLGKDGPPPDVVFEIASPRTFKEDLVTKLQLYPQALHAKEYFAYDPSKEQLWEGPRLKAWRLVEESHYLELERDARGWVWSEQLESWLVEDGPNLWLYDHKGNRRLTRAQQENRKALQERYRAEQAEMQVEQEMLRAEQAETLAQQEKLRAEQAETLAQQEKLRAEQMAARLRELEARLQKLDSAAEA
jgi:Uma2 family endonuclease